MHNEIGYWTLGTRLNHVVVCRYISKHQVDHRWDVVELGNYRYVTKCVQFKQDVDVQRRWINLMRSLNLQQKERLQISTNQDT